MSRLFEWFYNDLGKGPSESEMQEIRNIVLEEAGFQWIPVSERLPETENTVLVTDEYGYGNSGYYSVDDKCWYLDGVGVVPTILAWMPLPKPYEPKP